MFDNIGPAELLTLALVGMFVLGPERLPEAARWVARAVQTVKEYASGARAQLRDELGTDYDELRKPLEDLRSVRDLDPRRVVRRTLFDDPPGDMGGSTPIGKRSSTIPPVDGSWSGAGTPATPDPAIAGGAVSGAAYGMSGGATNGVPAAGAGSPVKGQSAVAAPSEPLRPGETAPLDPDAT